MTVAFILSMPGINSWNGKWSQEGKLFAVTRSAGAQKTIQRIKPILGKSFDYDFGDGWRASVNVCEVTPQEARSIRSKSKGFAGYDWMVDSIWNDGAIYGPTQPKPEAQPA